MSHISILSRQEDELLYMHIKRWGNGLDSGIFHIDEELSHGKVRMKYLRIMATALASEAGLRIGEITMLRGDDIQFVSEKAVQLRISHSRSKAMDTRRVPISRCLGIVIENYRKFLSQSGVEWPDGDIFTKNAIATRYNIRTTFRWIQEEVNEATGRITHPHILRHTFATRLLAVSDLRTVQELLGHRRINSTQVYLHVTDDQLKNAVDRRREHALS